VAGRTSLLIEQAGMKVEKAPDLGGWSVDGGSMCLGAQKAIGDARHGAEMFLTSVDGEKGTLKEIMTEGTPTAPPGRTTPTRSGAPASIG
jgi:hypothetical protein